MSPMMLQYLSIKEQNKDSILLFRLGDFYEMFFEDAKIASNELELVLTGKDCGLEERAPMCGIPYHSCEGYIARLIEKGYKVAICEQVEDPATAKGLVKRDIVRVITPGTVIEESMLDESCNNYLCAVSFQGDNCGICFADISTGEVKITEFAGKELLEKVKGELGRISPKEVLLNSESEYTDEIKKYCADRIGSCLTPLKSEYFDLSQSEEVITKHFKVESSSKIGLIPGSSSAVALSVALTYLYETQMSGLERITDISLYSDSQFMRLDITAMRNLELTSTLRSGEKKGSLLWVLDKTKTAPGRRMIRKWIEQPLINFAEITARHNAVEELTQNPIICGEIREALTGVLDIERIMTRISYGTAGGRELRALAQTASKLPAVKNQLSSLHSKLLQNANTEIDDLQDIYSLIDSIIVEEPPFSVKEGGIIKEGYNSELDLLRNDVNDGKGVIAEVEAAEKEKTGIKNLKVRYNKVFGYYIEVTNSFLDKVPEHYIRKQTLTNCERYITDELKKLESRVLGAKERSVDLEYQIFTQLRNRVNDELLRIQRTANALARVDVLCSLATVANNNNYCRPEINDAGRLKIIDGRHPVVEQMVTLPFVPNDTLLDIDQNRCAIITGPNMAGKSTYMRQVALITIMAQIGSFVPASSADIGIVDAVFTRVGASDDLTTGQSTFMVEMSEVAFILENATQNSLLILDEIGRGTSTYDGMAIARAVLEYVSDKKKIGAKTLFATHYHELTVLEGMLTGVKNYNIAVKKHGDNITFLRRIIRGGTDDSYGIDVAKLSGVPSAVINRAKQILKQLESDNPQIVVKATTEQKEETSAQMSLGSTQTEKLLDELSNLDVNTLTPIESMTKLFEICDLAKKLKLR